MTNSTYFRWNYPRLTGFTRTNFMVIDEDSEIENILEKLKVSFWKRQLAIVVKTNTFESDSRSFENQALLQKDQSLREYN